MSESSSRDHGVQPLDGVLEKLELTNQELVGFSTEQLTHKQVQKARRGRQVTPNIQGKIVRALNAAVESKGHGDRFLSGDLFSY